MIRLNRRKKGLAYRVVWFSDSPRFALWPPTIYRQSASQRPVAGLVRRPFHTFLSSLQGEPEAWLAAMSSTTRNEIRQAGKAGIVGCTPALADFVAFFNAFASEKGIEGTSNDKLKSYGSALFLTGAQVGERTLAMHALLVDSEAGRGRLLLSANARFLDAADRTLVGKANRWLHWWEMTQLAAKGLSVYDWGGYAKDSTDAAKQGINRFKEAFGGTSVEESHYYPFYFAGLED